MGRVSEFDGRFSLLDKLGEDFGYIVLHLANTKWSICQTGSNRAPTVQLRKSYLVLGPFHVLCSGYNEV